MTEPYVKIWLPGDPRGKGRHRSRIVTPKFKRPFVHHYADPETVKYEEAMGDAGRAAMIGLAVLDEPVSLAIDVFLSVPKSWSVKDRDRALVGLICPTGKPDGDNFQKVVQDSLNEIVWRDDSIIVRWAGGKFYSEVPGMLVSVWKWLA